MTVNWKMPVHAVPYEAPTLEGRALCDLGQQLAAMRDERDALRAELAAMTAKCEAAEDEAVALWERLTAMAAERPQRPSRLSELLQRAGYEPDSRYVNPGRPRQRTGRTR